jgi:hypothetical protein
MTISRPRRRRDSRSFSAKLPCSRADLFELDYFFALLLLTASNEGWIETMIEPIGAKAKSCR